jgi:hypothetical protein
MQIGSFPFSLTKGNAIQRSPAITCSDAILLLYISLRWPLTVVTRMSSKHPNASLFMPSFRYAFSNAITI